MCGRYSLILIFEEILDFFNSLVEDLGTSGFTPRYNVAPSDVMPVVVAEKGQNRIKLMRWGLIPGWAKDGSIGNRLINARVETVAEKPAFKQPLARRRCLVPADGYYEWQKIAGGKVPHRIVAPGRRLFAFAGLWDEWRTPEGSTITSYTIITTEAGPELAHIHDRMPLILPRGLEELWLTGPERGQSIQDFLGIFKPEKDLEFYRVSPLVNSPKNDMPECILPVPTN